ncbi:MAG: hypothetical protein GWN18_16340 [Thermoplasmata archaeon]|nr:hypothetical protein [Thermoplasmata archaeon]NIS13642.1 hypothetical protein [Thermoplasmata archaeon]NIS21514.1 hypothetical protein [Thermoplasmata archaeon]NIT79080.1 hypothetical protein [Thermoplasmata archaeon]NIU50560.1 hypothetical protein [Thermoplasmata archaeon]
MGLKEGRNLIEVRSEDAAGNVGTADWTIESERDFYFGGSSLIILIVIILVVSVVAALYWMRHSRPGRPPE